MMGNFNHDFLHQIDLDSEQRAEAAVRTQEQLLEQLLRHAYNRRTELHRKRRLARFGFLLSDWAHLKHTEDYNKN